MTPQNNPASAVKATKNPPIGLAIAKDVPLSGYSTMRLGGKAAYATGVSLREQIVQAYQWAKDRQLPCIVVGSGSNIVWRDEGFPGLLIVNQLKGFEIHDFKAHGFEIHGKNPLGTASAAGAAAGGTNSALVTIGGGENWDKAVGRCVQAGLSGIEALSLVPGTAGATPVQNVGAYGQEIANTLVSVEAYDNVAGNFTTIAAEDCAFGYRTSRFKTIDRGRFFICAITLRLTYTNPQPPFYNALQKYLDEHSIRAYTPQVIRDAVIAIRSSKLPDPNVVANNGSFFANPIVDQAVYGRIAAAFAVGGANAGSTSTQQVTDSAATIPHWPTADGRIKMSAAWLLEQAGFKDVHNSETGMATWHMQPLVLVNEHARSAQDLLAFRQKIIDAVEDKFGVTLEQEPELLP